MKVANLYSQVVKNLQKRPHQKLQSVLIKTLPSQKDLLLKHIQNYFILHVKQNVTQKSQTIVFYHHQHQHLFSHEPSITIDLDIDANDVSVSSDTQEPTGDILTLLHDVQDSQPLEFPETDQEPNN